LLTSGREIQRDGEGEVNKHRKGYYDDGKGNMGSVLNAISV